MNSSGWSLNPSYAACMPAGFILWLYMGLISNFSSRIKVRMIFEFRSMECLENSSMVDAITDAIHESSMATLLKIAY